MGKPKNDFLKVGANENKFSILTDSSLLKTPTGLLPLEKLFPEENSKIKQISLQNREIPRFVLN